MKEMNGKKIINVSHFSSLQKYLDLDTKNGGERNV